MIPTHDAQQLTCDLFSSEGRLPPAVTHRVAGLLADRVVSSWALTPPKRAHPLWESVARFGAKLFEECLPDGLHISLSPVPAKDDRIGWAIASKSLDKLNSRLIDFSRHVLDPGRKNELGALSVLLADEVARSPDDAVWLAFLCRVLLIDSAKGKEAAEIDCLIACICRTGVMWIAAERKDGKKGTGFAQLDSLRTVLLIESTPVVQGIAASGATSVLRFVSRASGQKPNAK